MADERCGTCRFALDFVTKTATDGNCFRFPPWGDREWPCIKPSDWCGEWQPRKAASGSHGRGVVSPAPTRFRTLEAARERR